METSFYRIVTDDAGGFCLFSNDSTDNVGKAQVKEWLKNNPNWTLKKSPNDTEGDCTLEKITLINQET